MEKELKKLIREEILREQMTLDESIEYIWNFKEANVE